MHYSVDWLKTRYDQGDTLKYLFFWGHSAKKNQSLGAFVFSQWYPAPFTVDGITYNTTEHWMMAAKAVLFEDHEIRQRILRADKPGEAKELGRQVTNFDPELWDQYKYDIVRKGNEHKFQQHPALAEFLRQTGDRILAEASPVDPVWGIGMAIDYPHVENPYSWKGSNLLGFALMEVRDIL